MILVPSVKIPCSFSQTNQYLLSLSLEQLIALWALVYSWRAHPHGKMLSNTPCIMEMGSNGKTHEPSSPLQQPEHDFTCFLVHNGSHWSCQTVTAGQVVLVLNLLETKRYNIRIWITCGLPIAEFCAQSVLASHITITMLPSCYCNSNQLPFCSAWAKPHLLFNP